MRVLFSLIFIFLALGESMAGFERWSTEVQSNPFTGGKDVNILYIVSRAQQVQIRCDSSDDGIQFVAIPGFEMQSDLVDKVVDVKLAVDGEIIVSNQSGVVSAFGANLAGVTIPLDIENSKKITAAFISAQSQIAISDGISSQPFFLSARGSTKAGKSLQQCYEVQTGAKSTIETEASDDKKTRIIEIKKKILELQLELQSLQEE